MPSSATMGRAWRDISSYVRRDRRERSMYSLRLMVGDVIGNYRILRKIGEGGMGTVYIAEHTLIGRKAAIKVLQREMSYRRELVMRFFNEAKAATAVKHPGIVELYDF